MSRPFVSFRSVCSPAGEQYAGPTGSGVWWCKPFVLVPYRWRPPGDMFRRGRPR